jgi:hypothetical protein
MQIEALREMVERGSRENPHLTSRLEKAAFIVALRPIERCDTGTYRVTSEDGLRAYVVSNGACECSDYTRHGEGFYCSTTGRSLLGRLNGGGNGKGRGS